MMTPTRRDMIAGAAALAAFPATALAQKKSALERIREETGGRLGLAVYDSGTGRRFFDGAEARYAMCSTFKVPLAAAVLARADRGEIDLAREIRFSEADVLSHAPVVKANLAKGALPIETLLQAAVEVSDNSAANLVFGQISGPRGLTKFIRSTGDVITRSDRDEPTLNIVRNGEVRDTTTPQAMLWLLNALLLGETLSPASRTKLIGWMEASPTGKERLRAGLPKSWRVGDKTGTSGEGYVNDVAIAVPPGRKPILITCYMDAPMLPLAQANAAHVKVGELVGLLFA
ncbi:class A beta-lactamase [Sphingomonas sp. BT-65]|uniref:class A beta-lactamase n=1 Tax=Sphingomonas sp. BT-65 TaxID=2989821 RepID=UPI002235E19C|nr:class A beta-lactamase [Sphingomonas sp. BT-65]MCW4463745.1 class A beta-lactamase [Sphingomonas sp. BT-65]